jgi:DNA-binding CsgD family transcriptional regulator
MVGFLLAGYFEMIFKQIGGFFIKEVDQSLSFYYSTIPYFLWSLFSLYYFRKYYGLNVFTQGEIVLSTRFIERFAITKREQEIILLLVQGFSNKVIAEKLFISLATVKSHVHNILETTKAKSRMRLLYLVRRIK